MPLCETLTNQLELKRLPKKDNLPIEVLQLDVTDDKLVTDAISEISNKQARIDLQVNNAGYDVTGAVEELSMDENQVQFAD